MKTKIIKIIIAVVLLMSLAVLSSGCKKLKVSFEDDKKKEAKEEKPTHMSESRALGIAKDEIGEFYAKHNNYEYYEVKWGNCYVEGYIDEGDDAGANVVLNGTIYGTTEDGISYDEETIDEVILVRNDGTWELG